MIDEIECLNCGELFTRYEDDEFICEECAIVLSED